jgi:tripartite motif-containing protein 71
MLIPVLASLLAMGTARAESAPSFEFDFKFGKSISRNTGETNYPSGIAYDPIGGGSFVMDLLNNRIKHYDADGEFVHYWLCQQGLGLAVDPRNGIVWVAMWKNHTVNAYSPTGVLLATLGTPKKKGTEPGQFSSPHDVGIDPATGELYVLDTGNGRIQVFDINLDPPQAARLPAESRRASPKTDWKKFWVAVYVDNFEGELTEVPHASPFVTELTTGLAEVGEMVREIDVSDYTPTAQFSREFGLEDDDPIGLKTPYSLAVHPKGEFVVVANTGQQEIIKFSPQGEVINRWRHPANETGKALRRGDAMGSEAGQFRWPQGVAVGGDGHIYVADTDNERAQVLDPDGQFLQFIQGPSGTQSGSFHPRAIDVNPETGAILVTATAANRIDRFDETGTHAGSFGHRDSRTASFNQLKGIAVDSETERIYLSDWMDHRIRIFDLRGHYEGSIEPWITSQHLTDGSVLSEEFITAPETQMWPVKEHQSFPGAMDLDDSGNIWLLRGAMHYDDDPRQEADWLVRSFSSEGELIAGFGHRHFPRNARMRGVTVDRASGHVYVSNSMRHSVMKFDMKGALVWEAGSERGSGSDQFDHPTGLALSSDGSSLYVIDAKNHRIQVLSSSGEFLYAWGEKGSELGQFHFSQFNGLDVDDRGYLYIGDSNNHRVQVLNSDGEAVTEMGQKGPGGIGHYQGIPDVEVADDKLYVLDSARGRVEVYSIHFSD